jgi:hypothetical protein
MEISPIPGIRALPTLKPPKNSPQLSAIFEIENAFGPQQDTYSNGGRNLAGGLDDESVEQDEATRSTDESSPSESGSTVNLVA